jgi:hypothetical protein
MHCASSVSQGLESKGVNQSRPAGLQMEVQLQRGNLKHLKNPVETPRMAAWMPFSS